MAGDWLKMTHNLPEKPEVLAIAGATGLNRLEVVGRLFIMWRWFDQNTVDGNGAGVTKVTLSECLFGVSSDTKFIQAVIDSGWLIENEAGISAKNFDYHISESAKERAQTAKRVAKSKANKGSTSGNGEGNATSVTKPVPREEKRREQIQTPLIPPEGGTAVKETGKKVAFAVFLQACRDAKEAPISGYRPVWEYAEQIKLPTPFLELAWDEFKAYYRSNPKGQRAKHVDWRLTFLNSIKQTRGGLWRIGNDGQYVLTTRGEQAKREQDAHDRQPRTPLETTA